MHSLAGEILSFFNSFLDDDICSGTAFDEHTECNQANLNDSNIVDYLLNLSQDLKHQSPHIQTPVTMPQPKVRTVRLKKKIASVKISLYF